MEIHKIKNKMENRKYKCNKMRLGKRVKVLSNYFFGNLIFPTKELDAFSFYTIVQREYLKIKQMRV